MWDVSPLPFRHKIREGMRIHVYIRLEAIVYELVECDLAAMASNSSEVDEHRVGWQGMMAL